VTDQPLGTSAFGSYNVIAGPFYDLVKQAASPLILPRPPPDWEREDFMEGRNGIPINVGKQGRKKAREKLEQQARRLEDEEDDWFEHPRRARTPTGPALRRHGNGRFDGHSRRHDSPSPRRAPSSHAQRQMHAKPALLDRIDLTNIPPMRLDHAGYNASTSRRHRDTGHSQRHRDQDGSRRRDSSGRHSWRDDDGYHHNRRPDGPRYRGGYSNGYSY
jgi:protein AIR1/2